MIFINLFKGFGIQCKNHRRIKIDKTTCTQTKRGRSTGKEFDRSESTIVQGNFKP
jgi:hypothetical protein